MKYGLTPSPDDRRDFVRFALDAPVSLAPSATLAVDGWLPDVKNQGSDEDCVAGAMHYSRSLMRYRNTHQVRDFSFHWFFYQLRQMEGTLGQNTGTYPRDAMKVARKRGFCPDEIMPLSQGDYNEQPPAGADDAAYGFRITRYLRCFNLTAIKTEIALGNPVLLGIFVNQNFENGGNGGVIDWDGNQNWLGGHAIWPYAFVDDTRYNGGGYILIRNQWGNWANNGDAALTYAFMQSPAFMEAWSYT